MLVMYTHLRKWAFIVFLWVIELFLFEMKHAEILGDPEHKPYQSLALHFTQSLQWDWALQF